LSNDRLGVFSAELLKIIMPEYLGLISSLFN